MDFLAGGELAPLEQANGHVEQGVEDDPDAAEQPQVAPIMSLPDAGTYDPNYMLGVGVQTPAATREQGSHSFAEGDIPLGTVGFNPKLSEWEDKTSSERKTRQEAAVKKEAEMKAAAAAALAEHRAQREKAAADTLAANKAAEEAEAAEAAGETNPWKTIYKMVEEHVDAHVHTGNQRYHDLLLNLKEQGKSASTREGVPPG